jgi:hypothetical protein
MKNKNWKILNLLAILNIILVIVDVRLFYLVCYMMLFLISIIPVFIIAIIFIFMLEGRKLRKIEIKW